MFSADRWAKAFLNSAGADVDESLSLLKAIVKATGGIYFEGSSDARHLERLLHCALKKAGIEGFCAELACRTVVLLVRKHLFPHSQELIEALETQLRVQAGVVTARIDSASPLEPEIQSSFIQHIKEKTRAEEVRITTCIIPELLGGYRLLIDNELFDASVKTQFAEMAISMLKD